VFARPELKVLQNSAEVSIVRINSEIRLEWDTNNNGNEAACSLTGAGVTSAMLTNGTGDNETGYQSPITINGRTVFKIDCAGLVDTVTVDVIPQSSET
jgi:hypothetical protein